MFKAPEVGGADKELLNDFQQYYRDLVFYQAGLKETKVKKNDLTPEGIEHILSLISRHIY